jgi:TDG/mug DNA glycosylase family protein
VRSAQTGHHFAGHSNRFWKLLYDSGLVTEPLTYREDWRLPEWSLGLANIIGRSSAGIDALDPREYRRGAAILERKIRRYRPAIVALLGVTIFRRLFPRSSKSGRRVNLGPTGLEIAGARVFLLPNPSGRNAYYSYSTMLAGFRALCKEVDSHRR